VLGWAVIGRAAFYDVADIDIAVSITTHCCDHVGEELPCGAHERESLPVLIVTRGIADKNEVCFGIADPVHQPIASAMKLASVAVANDIILQDAKPFGGWCRHGHDGGQALNKHCCMGGGRSLVSLGSSCRANRRGGRWSFRRCRQRSASCG
jgi:hypothetical protein